LSGANVPIRTKESAYFRVIISCLQIVESAFGIVVVATVTEGVYICYMRRRGNGVTVSVSDGEDFAPCVISILGDGVSVFIAYPENITLYILLVVINRAIILKTYYTSRLIVIIVYGVCSVFQFVVYNFFYYLCSVESIRTGLSETGYRVKSRFTCTYAVGIVSIIGEVVVSITVACELSAVP